MVMMAAVLEPSVPPTAAAGTPAPTVPSAPAKRPAAAELQDDTAAAAAAAAEHHRSVERTSPSTRKAPADVGHAQHGDMGPVEPAAGAGACGRTGGRSCADEQQQKRRLDLLREMLPTFLKAEVEGVRGLDMLKIFIQVGSLHSAWSPR